MKQIMPGIGLAALAALALLWLVNDNGGPSVANADPIEKGAAPAWELKDPDGKIVKSTDFKGKIVLLDFWATWCGPCVAEIPSFIELQKKYEKDGLAIVGISLDDKDATVKKFIKDKKLNYTVVMGNEAVNKAYGGIEYIPTTFMIGRDGNVFKTHVGATSKSEFEKDIKALLASPKP